MSTTQRQSIGNSIIEKQALDKRLETVGWGLFLILSGGVWFVPGWQVPEDLWLIGVGAIILGRNALRYLNGIQPRWFGIILGISALLAGVGGLFRLSLPVLPLLFMLLGAYLLFRSASQG